MPLFSDFYRSSSFDPGSTLGSRNFLVPLANTASYTVTQSSTTSWIITLTTAAGVVSRIEFIAATTFVPGPGQIPPLGAIGEIRTYTAAGQPVASFAGLAELNIGISALIAQPGLLVSGNDDFFGSSGADEIHLGNGNDYGGGGAGNDILHGDDGSDVLYDDGDPNETDQLFGGAGNDLLVGNFRDTFDGGADFDVAWVSFDGMASGVTLDVSGGAGASLNLPGGGTVSRVESIWLTGSAFADTFTAGDYGAYLDGAGGNDILRGGAGGDEIHGGDGVDQLYGGGGDDLLVVIAGAGNAGGNYAGEVWDGGAGFDLIGITRSADLRGANQPTVANLDGIMFAYDGFDTAELRVDSTFFNGFAAFSDLRGVVGRPESIVIDIVAGRQNVDFVGWRLVDWTSGEDLIRINGNDSNNVLYGSFGDDEIYGHGGDDALAGYGGVNILDGGDGDDTLFINETPGPGIASGSRWIGGAGTDTLVLNGNVNVSGEHYLAELSGIERVYFGAAAGYASTWLTIDNWFLSRMPAQFVVRGSFQSGQSNVVEVLLSDTMTSFDASSITFELWLAEDYLRVVGSGLADTITGSATSDRLYGNDGDDTLNGGGGNDELHGGYGVDQMFGGAGDDRLFVQGDAPPPPPGSWDGEVWDGGEGVDLITAFTAYTVDLRGADVTIQNMEGFAFWPVTDSTLIVDQAVLDQMPADLIIAGTHLSSNALIVHLGEGGTGLDISGWTFTDWSRLDRIEIHGSAGDNTLTGSVHRDVLIGGDGNDVLIGGGVAHTVDGGYLDTLDGGDGDDLLVLSGGHSGYGGDSYIDGGAGLDTLRVVAAGGEGAEFVFDLEYFSGIERVEFEGESGERAITRFLADSPAELIGFLSSGVHFVGSDSDDLLRLQISVDGPVSTLDLSGVTYATTGLDLALRGRMNQPLSGVQIGVNEGFYQAFHVTGSAADERLVGDIANDILSGGGGNDLLTGNRGDDQYFGGEGDDYLYVHAMNEDAQANYSAEVWDGGNGTDFLAFGASLDLRNAANLASISSIEGLAFARGGGPVTLTLGSAFVNALALSVLVEGQDGQADRVDVEVTAGGGPMNLSGWSFSSWEAGDLIQIVGSGQADSVTGTAHGDRIFGGAGNDVLRGHLGNDLIDGGDGTDTAAFAFARAGAEIVSWRGVLAVGGAGGEGMDRLTSIEQLQFSDQTVGASSLARFDIYGYIAGYDDLMVTYGVHNLDGAVEHFITTGFAQGRDTDQFSGIQYIAGYNDLIMAFGTDEDVAGRHYIQFGVSGGRVRDNFNGADYIASYNDLIMAFGLDEDVAARHYIQFGYSSGRSRDTFDGWQYIASYDDLIVGIGADEAEAARHFVQTGYGQGRARDVYNWLEYIAGYDDLIVAFGADETAGARHYVETGFAAGRARDAFDGLQYIASYADLIVSFGEDEGRGASHYIQFGFNEGRARDTFDAAQYLANYADLQAVFGNDLYNATRHYILYGYYEGRTDDDLTPNGDDGGLAILADKGDSVYVSPLEFDTAVAHKGEPAPEVLPDDADFGALRLALDDGFLMQGFVDTSADLRAKGIVMPPEWAVISA